MGEILVCKFGGTSLSGREGFRRVRDIIKSDPRRRYIVVSAPGKRFTCDIKVTDRLINAYALKSPEALEGAKEIFREIADMIAPGYFDADIASLDRAARVSRDMSASRGEWLCARMLARYAGMPFIDAAELFAFNGGEIDRAETRLRLENLPGEGAVIPGFYGADEMGQIITFPRGGSDICGALVAEAVGAAAYENWTDVDGFFTADPAVVKGAMPLRELSYSMARRLSRLGAGVLHHDCIAPAEEAGIPIIVKNTLNPLSPGTRVSSDAPGTRPLIAIAMQTRDTCRISIADIDDSCAVEIMAALPLNAQTRMASSALSVTCPREITDAVASEIHRAIYGK